MAKTIKTAKSANTGAKLLAFVAISALCAGSAAAQNVVVQGNRSVDPDTIRSFVTARNGDLAGARQDMLNSGLFSRVTMGQQGGNVVVRVTEKTQAARSSAIVNRVAFEGNSKIKGDSIRTELQTQAGNNFSEAVLQSDVQRVREIYRRSGRALAQVSARTVDLANNRRDVVFTISEGSKTDIKEIKFIGNNNVSNWRLKNQMNTTESNLLSFLKTSDIYDEDRVNADLELIRRYYLRNGYADMRIVNNSVVFDQARGGYVMTVEIDEGPQYRIGNVRVDSRVPELPESVAAGSIRTRTGDVYNAESVEKSLVGITNNASRRGLAFTQARPVGDRNPGTRTIDLAYVIDEGPRVYVERIVVRGNTRTRDYVVRREFDMAEGDAYNKVLVDRAERRLNNLGFFKKVRVTNEPGSSPDRVVINVDVEDQPTGAFSVGGGYSTTDKFLAEASISESNFMGRGQYVKLGVTYGQQSNGFDFSFTEPFFMGNRVAVGIDLFTKNQKNSVFSPYDTKTAGGTIRAGFAITEEFSVGLRYSLYQTKLTVPNTNSRPYLDCSQPITGFTGATANCPATGALGAVGSVVNGVTLTDAYQNGEAPTAIKEAIGNTLTSLAGYSLIYNSLDNTKDPRSGLFAEFRQDFAGLGGDSRFIRTSGDARYYYEIFEDVVGVVRGQAGHVMGFGGKSLRIMDHYFMGPQIVRGFAPSGIGPRELSLGGDLRGSAVGATTYWGGTAEVQFPIFGIPREVGLRGAVFADVGSAFGNKSGSSTGLSCTEATTGLTGQVRNYNVLGSVVSSCVRDSRKIRSSVGASILWKSPLGPIRFDYAFALSKDRGDRLQAFRFSGGTSF
ncbi:MAG: outer membrane protein assembly factor BamA [Beijerinckiaceae bacterium]